MRNRHGLYAVIHHSGSRKTICVVSKKDAEGFELFDYRRSIESQDIPEDDRIQVD